MRMLYVFFIAMLCNSFAINAQSKCGLYRTVGDFETQHISIPAQGKYGRKAIRVSDFFLHPYIYIISDSGNQRFSIDSIYGIKCSTGKEYRIWEQKPYLIEECSHLVIYSYIGTCPVKQHTPRGYHYRNKMITTYYFSKSYRSELHPLNTENLIKVFNLDARTETLLLEAFPNEKSLQMKTDNVFNINKFLNSIK